MAWTGNFKDQIVALTGGIPNEADAKQWVLDGCYDIANRVVIKFGKDEIWKFVAKSSTGITGGTTDIDEVRAIHAVVRNGVYATKGDWALKSKYNDSDSIYQATDSHPIWYEDDSTLYIYPAPGVGASAYYYFLPEYAIGSWDSAVSSISDFPPTYYYPAVLFSSMKVLHAKMLAKDMPTFSVFVATATPPDSISMPVLTAPLVEVVSAPDITEELPIYVGQTIGGSALGDLASQSISDLAIPYSAPAIPTISTITYTPVSVFDMENIDTISVNDIADVSDAIGASVDSSIFDSNAPTYSDQAAPVVPSISAELIKMKGYVNDDEDPELSRAKSEEIQAILSSFPLELQHFQAEISDAKNIYDKENVEYQAKLQEAMQNAQADNQVVLQNMQKDITIAQQNLQKDLDIAKQDSSNEAARKQANAQQKQAALMQDAIQVVQGVVADNSAKMQLHQEELGTYTAQVDSMVKEYQQNVQKTTQLWQVTNGSILQEHDARVKDELNKFNAENAKYQAHVQSVMSKHQGDLQRVAKNADFELQKDIQDYTFRLEKWQKDIGLYSETVNSSIGEYTQNLQRYQAESQSTPVEYQWLQDQYGRLKMEYEQLLGAGQAAPATQ